MKRFLSIIVAIVAFTCFGGNVEAQTKTCLLYRGDGGEAIFPGWPAKKLAILEVSKSVTVWLNDACAQPTVVMTGGSNVKVSVEKEDLSEPTNVAVGWRIYLWTTDSSDAGKTVRVTIRSGKQTFHVEVRVHEHVLGLARSAAKDASDANAKADEAKATSDEAKSTADEAHKNTGGTGGKRDIELVLSPMLSLESPGREGYGMALGVNAILGKFASKGMVQLGVSGRMSWHYYEQEVIGLAQNSDVMAHEFDALAMFLFRLRPVNWFALEGTTGFGVRIFTHDDAVTIQDQDLLIRGVEGRVAYHPIWALNLGVKFWPHEVISLGLNWGTTVAMTRQVQNPNAEGGNPSKANCWNHFLLFNLGFNF